MISSNSGLNEKYRELCTLVGHLFIAFARLEGTLSSILKVHLAQQIDQSETVESIALSSAIYGSMRFKAARDTIKRIASSEENSKESLDLALKIFAQVAQIEDFRDKIAHQQMTPAYDGASAYWQITDVTSTRDIRNPKVYVFDSDAVGAAAEDLLIAGSRLGKNSTKTSILSGLSSDLSPVSWHFKSSMLKLVPLSKLRIP